MLMWTAPGDDSFTGTASEYDVRYSRSCDPDCVLWDKQCKPSIVPPPASAGYPESLLIEGLAPATEYCFTIRTVDDKRFWSDWSNVAPCSTGFSRAEVTAGIDAEILALDISGELLAPQDLTTLIEDDLITIRDQHPYFWTVHARPTTRLGMITLGLTAQAWTGLQEGTYHGLDELEAQYGPSEIVSSVSYDWVTYADFKFQKRYNSDLLAEIYADAEGVLSSESVPMGGGGDDITATSRGSYTFTVRWGDCYAGCAHGHYWTFTVTHAEVELVDEGGDLLPCAPWCYD